MLKKKLDLINSDFQSRVSKIEKKLDDEHKRHVDELLKKAGITGADASEFRRFGSARNLYNFDVDNADAY